VGSLSEKKAFQFKISGIWWKQKDGTHTESHKATFVSTHSIPPNNREVLV